MLETLVALAIVALGFLGALATVTHSGKMASAAEEDALASSAMEQRIDQLRLLEWPELTGTSGITSKVYTARPSSMSGITVAQETITVTGYDVANAKSLFVTWIGNISPIAVMVGTGPDLSTASAVKVVATVRWTGRRSKKQENRSSVTVISRGGISKSDLP